MPIVKLIAGNWADDAEWDDEFMEPKKKNRAKPVKQRDVVNVVHANSYEALTEPVAPPLPERQIPFSSALGVEPAETSSLEVSGPSTSEEPQVPSQTEQEYLPLLPDPPAKKPRKKRVAPPVES